MRADRFSDVVVGHGEGPVWWPADGLRICDGYAGRIVGLDADGGVVGALTVGSFVGAFRPRVGGGTVAAAKRSFVLVDTDGTVGDLGEIWADPSVRMNDGGTDPQGRFYAGSMPEQPGTGSLYRLTPRPHDAPRLDVVLEGVSCSNGLAFSPDGHRCYYIDTPTHRVDVFDVDPAGDWHDRRPLAHLGDANPDGMTVDTQGHLWVALFGGGQVICLDPGSGTTLEVIEVEGAAQTTACTFGGPDLDQLFITTSDENGTGGPVAGSVFVARPGVTGILPVPFAG
ncbi:MAG: SMP-30/gluconolactonase/LRE family protein [Propionibacteriaceae bacterium]